MINIVIAFPKQEEADGIKAILMRHGYNVVAAYTSGSAAVHALDGMDDGILICGYRLSDMIYMQLRDYMPSSFEMLLITSRIIDDISVGSGIICLPLPLKGNSLINTVEMLSETIYQRRKKRKKQPLKRNEDEKKLIEDAKKVLMEKNNMTEPEAHRYIQKTSMDTGSTLSATAEMVIGILLR
ncbi:ANTAR domain-containing response regulator [Parasporobacterium paucivorans]|uniref:Response regulator NasT n=1 Tax=Parasporobacterium paucivorans DSM 15970 TaxID=1122934 RepID=A0A1M6H772_9FIRM|nr:ANTAR domain-containing protein [Parasporobacterium paucivorans]SHJ18045.1 response regulator NasT [Parasporobacterium paucivorans DSM 15970]